MKAPIDAPPCIQLGQPMNHCAKRRYDEQILGNIALFGDWSKWRFAGRDLVTPDGLRISPQRLRNILMAENLRNRSKIAERAQKQLPDNVLRPKFGTASPQSIS